MTHFRIRCRAPLCKELVLRVYIHTTPETLECVRRTKEISWTCDVQGKTLVPGLLQHDQNNLGTNVGA